MDLAGLDADDLKELIKAYGGDPSTCSNRNELVTLAKSLLGISPPKDTKDADEDVVREDEKDEAPSDETIRNLPIKSGSVFTCIHHEMAENSSSELGSFWIRAIVRLDARLEFKRILSLQQLGAHLIRSYSSIKDELKLAMRNGRPAYVVFDDEELYYNLCDWVKSGLGLECKRVKETDLVGVDEIMYMMKKLYASANMDFGLSPTLLSVEGVTKPFLAEFYKYCTYLHKKAPWKKIDNVQPIGVKVNDGPEWIIALMGNGGTEFGMTLFNSANSWKWMMENARNPSPEFSEQYVDRGQHSLSFESMEHVRINDVLIAISEGWELPDNLFESQAFPTPRLMKRQNETPPSKEMLVFYMALARCLPTFAAELKPIFPYNPIVNIRMFHPLTKSYSFVSPVEGKLTVNIRYPAVDFSGSMRDLFGM